jgi:hypothetical protein
MQIFLAVIRLLKQDRIYFFGVGYRGLYYALLSELAVIKEKRSPNLWSFFIVISLFFTFYPKGIL